MLYYTCVTRGYLIPRRCSTSSRWAKLADTWETHQGHGSDVRHRPWITVDHCPRDQPVDVGLTCAISTVSSSSSTGGCRKKHVKKHHNKNALRDRVFMILTVAMLRDCDQPK